MIPFHLTDFVPQALDWLNGHRIVFLALVILAGVVVGRCLGQLPLKIVIWREGQNAESEWRDRHRAELERHDRLMRMVDDAKSRRMHRVMHGGKDVA